MNMSHPPIACFNATVVIGWVFMFQSVNDRDTQKYLNQLDTKDDSQYIIF